VLMVLVVFFLPRGIVPAVQRYLPARKPRAVVADAVSVSPGSLQK
jgi:hypothetical protein